MAASAQSVPCSKLLRAQPPRYGLRSARAWLVGQHADHVTVKGQWTPPRQQWVVISVLPVPGKAL